MVTNHHQQEQYSLEFKRHLKRSEIDNFHPEASLASENSSDSAKPRGWWQSFWQWTGITDKKGLDIAQVLLLPLILAIGGYLWNFQAEQRATKLANEKYRQDALEGYITLIADLVEKGSTKNNQHSLTIYSLEQAKTNATLQLLKGDKSRREILLGFLREAGLLTGTSQQTNAPPGIRPILEGITLRDIDLQEADLTNAKLAKANFSKADLSQASLNRACLYKATLSNAILTGTKLRQANLRQAFLVETNLTQAELIAANLLGANLDKATLNGTILTDAIYDSKTTFPKGFNPLHNGMIPIQAYTNLSGKDLKTVDLPNANLQGADLQQSNLQRANLINANLQGADLQQSKLQRANLTNANLSGANLIEVDLSQANLSSVNFVGVRLIDAKLEGAKLINANLRGSILTGAKLIGADLTGSNLTGTDLTNANLKGAKGFSSTSPRLCNTVLPNGKPTKRDCPK